MELASISNERFFHLVTREIEVTKKNGVPAPEVLSRVISHVANGDEFSDGAWFYQNESNISALVAVIDSNAHDDVDLSLAVRVGRNIQHILPYGGDPKPRITKHLLEAYQQLL